MRNSCTTSSRQNAMNPTIHEKYGIKSPLLLSVHFDIQLAPEHSRFSSIYFLISKHQHAVTKATLTMALWRNHKPFPTHRPSQVRIFGLYPSPGY